MEWATQVKHHALQMFKNNENISYTSTKQKVIQTWLSWWLALCEYLTHDLSIFLRKYLLHLTSLVYVRSRLTINHICYTSERTYLHGHRLSCSLYLNLWLCLCIKMMNFISTKKVLLWVAIRIYAVPIIINKKDFGIRVCSQSSIIWLEIKFHFNFKIVMKPASIL